MRMRGCGGWSRRRWDLWVTWRGGGWGMAHPAATSGQVRKSRCPSRAGGTGICVVRSVVMATLVLTVVGGIVGGLGGGGGCGGGVGGVRGVVVTSVGPWGERGRGRLGDGPPRCD